MKLVVFVALIFFLCLFLSFPDLNAFLCKGNEIAVKLTSQLDLCVLFSFFFSLVNLHKHQSFVCHEFSYNQELFMAIYHHVGDTAGNRRWWMAGRAPALCLY